MTNRRIPGLDGLRAISIGLVLLMHLSSFPGFPKWKWLVPIASGGQFGVEVFFVLSGFLITWLLLQEESRNGRIDLRQFYLRRAFRILPPAMFYLAFISVLVVLHVSSAANDLIPAACFFRNFSGEGSSDTAHFWSLAIEEQFYLLWPFLLIVMRKNLRVPAVIGMLGFLIVWRHEYYRFFLHASINTFQFHYDGLLMGCLLALALTSQAAGYLHGRTMRSGWFSSAALAVIVLCLSPLANHLPSKLVACLPTIEVLCVALVINFLIQPRLTLARRVLDTRPMVWIGVLSYSLYLWQQPFCYFSSSLACAFPFNLSLGLLGAVFSYYLIEQPALRLRQGLKSRRSAPADEPSLMPAHS